MSTNKTTITKSDFRMFREAPRHLWAKKNNHLDAITVDQLASIQGQEIELLAKGYIESIIASGGQGLKLSWQETQQDGPFLARADALVGSESGRVRSLYEIKSRTEVKEEDIEDAAFQTLILRQKYEVVQVYLVLVDNTYTRKGPLEVDRVLIAEDVTAQVNTILRDVENWRAEALQAAMATGPEELEHCWKPDECGCRELCHPGLPDFSIYNIPRISIENKRQLEGMGIRAAKDIPPTFPLPDLQRKISNLAQRDLPFIDGPGLRQELSGIAFPVYFLDYETCNLAIPKYDGYKPYQQIVFQYSLHRLDAPEAEPQHYEYLATSPSDPAANLVVSLRDNLGATGSVLVWNETFEKSRNRELAQLVPEHADFLLNLNSRIYDLMKVVRKGLYIHPGFKGSSSIKNVLPVVMPELSYREMEVNDGRKASYAWWQIMFGDLSKAVKDTTTKALLEYCKLDTLAIVELFRRFSNI